LAEGEFNRLYIRALCRRAIAEEADLQVYRARFSSQPDSESRIGELIDPAALLADLRAHNGQKTDLGVPGHPNSGVSVRLVRKRGGLGPADELD
jgi:hypothetical protein